VPLAVGMVIMALAVGVVSGHGMIVARAVEDPVPCLRGEGRSILPSPFEAVWNSSTESSIMAHSRDGVPP
jgi:hypothetical protein